MNKLTILLTLRDRAEYTKTWLKNNYFDSVDYLIADGSVSNENELFFEKNQKDNIKYIRFPKDINWETYYKKVLDASNMVQTPFVMNCDNDDFLNIYGLIKCVEFLENNSDYGFCGGKILGVVGTNKELSNGISLYKIKYGTTVDNSSLDGMKGINGVEKMFRPYRYIWYAVYRSSIFRQIWENIYETNLQSGHLNEMLQSQLAFCYGKYKDLSVNTYVRLENPASNDAAEESAVTTTEVWSHSRVYFDDDYRRGVKKMADVVSNLLVLPTEKVTNAYINFYDYSLLDKNYPTIPTRIKKKIMRGLTRITPKMSIQVLIRFINIYMR